MEKNNKKKKTIAIIVAIITIIVALLGTSYAYWVLTKTQRDSNDLVAACLDFEMYDLETDQYVALDGLSTYSKNSVEYVGGVELNSAMPLTNKEGIALNGYKFKVVNNCEDDDVAFSIGLLKTKLGDDYTALQDSSIKIALNDNVAGVYSSLNTTDIPKEATDALSAKVIDEGYLAGGEEKVYEVKLWIDKDAPSSERSSEEELKSWNGKVFVTGTLALSDDSIAMNTTPESCFEITDAGVITKYYANRPECGTSVSVPNSINGINVKEISSSAFKTSGEVNPDIKFAYAKKSNVNQDYQTYILNFYFANVNGGPEFDDVVTSLGANLYKVNDKFYFAPVDSIIIGSSEDTRYPSEEAEITPYKMFSNYESINLPVAVRIKIDDKYYLTGNETGIAYYKHRYNAVFYDDVSELVGVENVYYNEIENKYYVVSNNDKYAVINIMQKGMDDEHDEYYPTDNTVTLVDSSASVPSGYSFIGYLDSTKGIIRCFKQIDLDTFKTNRSQYESYDIYYEYCPFAYYVYYSTLDEMKEMTFDNNIVYATTYPLSRIYCVNGKDYDDYDCNRYNGIKPVAFMYANENEVSSSLPHGGKYDVIMYDEYKNLDIDDITIADYDARYIIQNFYQENDEGTPADKKALMRENPAYAAYYIDLSLIGEENPNVSYLDTTTLFEFNHLSVDKVDLSKCLYLEKIDEFAFSNLESLNITEECGEVAEMCVDQNGKYDFGNYKGLTALKLPANEEELKVGIGAFSGADLEELSIYNNISFVPLLIDESYSEEVQLDYLDRLGAAVLGGPLGFSNINNLRIFDVNGSKLYGSREPIAISASNELSSVLMSMMANVSLLTFDRVDNLYIDSSIDSIGVRTFGTVYIKDLYLPNSIKNIYKAAFIGLSADDSTDTYGNVHLNQTLAEFNAKVNNDDGISFDKWNVIEGTD